MSWKRWSNWWVEKDGPTDELKKMVKLMSWKRWSNWWVEKDGQTDELKKMVKLMSWKRWSNWWAEKDGKTDELKKMVKLMSWKNDPTDDLKKMVQLMSWKRWSNWWGRMSPIMSLYGNLWRQLVKQEQLDGECRSNEANQQKQLSYYLQIWSWKCKQRSQSTTFPRVPFDWK